MLPSGMLALEILNMWGLRHSWSDGKRKHLDDCLGDFVAGVLANARNEVERRSEQERERREWEERERRRLEEELRRWEEEQRVADLLQRVDLWARSEQVRAFVAAFRSSCADLDADTAQWLEWAEGVADRMDPLNKVATKVHDKDSGDA